MNPVLPSVRPIHRVSPGTLLIPLAGLVLVFALIQGCRNPDPPVDPSGDSWVDVDLEKSNARRLLTYYLGGYVSEGGGDPEAAGLLRYRDERPQLNLALFATRAGIPPDTLAPWTADGQIDWEEWKAIIHRSYYRARRIPPTWAEFSERVPYNSPEWLRYRVRGVVSTLPRNLFVNREALLEALTNYRINKDRLIYPPGTVFVADHLDDGERVETTVMRKREGDGMWDFFVYDREGNLASETATSDRPLDAPVQCVGCHYGKKRFEPEKSFPGRARPGPDGPRELVVSPAAKRPEVVRFFDEHARRSDGVLGIYATLLVSELVSRREQGVLREEEHALLDSLRLDNP